MPKSKVFVGLLAGAAALSLAACSSSDETDGGLLGAIESGNVTLGVKFDQPGIGLREGDGSYTGAETEIATKIVETLAEENGWDAPNIRLELGVSHRCAAGFRVGQRGFLGIGYLGHPSHFLQPGFPQS